MRVRFSQRPSWDSTIGITGRGYRTRVLLLRSLLHHEFLILDTGTHYSRNGLTPWVELGSYRTSSSALSRTVCS